MKLLTVYSLLACIIAFASAGCSSSGSSNSGSIIGSQVIVSEDRLVASFTSLDMRAVAAVSITQGAVQSVNLETDDNIIDHIMTTVSNGQLIISSDENYDTDHGVIISVTMTDIDRLELSGVGSIDSQNDFSVDDLELVLQGVGGILVSGSAQTLIAEMEGVGSIDAQALTSAISTVDLSGVGDCYVFATDELDVTISGVGDVFYAGNPPAIRETITGNGSLIAL